MDPEAFPGALFRTWEPRIPTNMNNTPMISTSTSIPAQAPAAGPMRSFEFGFSSGTMRREAKTLEELFKDYGVRLTTLAKMSEMGFTVQTLVNMTDQELEDVIKTMLEAYHIELLVGEKYGIKSAVRAERKFLDEEAKSKAQPAKKRRTDEATTSKDVQQWRENNNNNNNSNGNSLSVVPSDALNLNVTRDNSLLLIQQHTQLANYPASPEPESDSDRKRHTKKKQKRRRAKDDGEDGEDRPREHPFIVTEPGELARGKKNGLDYLFDLYEQCGKYLEEVQQQCKERGEKCPTKVTNQVFRHAKHRGASYINKPKMRHYVHCYALHCLDLEQSNHLRKAFKDRGENVGAWRQACYYPLVDMARNFNWDIEGLFSRNDKLRIWYVPTKLRQLCHIEKSKECH